MVSRLISVQKPLHTCTEHEYEETDNYCRTCKKPVCVKCVRTDHKEHNWDSMKNVARMLRFQAQTRKVELESVAKSIVAGFNETSDFVSNRFSREDSSNHVNLESTRKRLVEYVNDEINKMKSRCEKEQAEKTETLQLQRDKVKVKENRLKRLLQVLETGASELTDFDLIEMHQELDDLMNELQYLVEVPADLQHSIIYRSGSSSMSALTPLLGNLDVQQFAAKPVLRHEFQYSESSIRNICPLNGNTAWVQADGTTLVKLIDTKGNVKRSLDVQNDYADYAVDEDEIYFVDQNAKCLMKSDGNEKLKLLSSTAPFIPSSIFITSSGDILICLTEIEDSTGGTKSLRYFVRRMTKTGTRMKDDELVCDTITSHYSSPWRVVELPNGNICVLMLFIKSNDDNPEFSVIYCINSSGKRVFQYGKDKQYGILDICHDMIGNILASELENKRIHIIDTKGNFVRFLLNQASFKHLPGTIAFLGNNLWVGADGIGMIQVYKCD